MFCCYFFPDVNQSGTIDMKDFDLAVQVSTALNYFLSHYYMLLLQVPNL